MALKCARRWCIALIVVLALYTTFRFTLYLMVQAKLYEIRKQGYPVTLAELDKWYPQPPTAENAASVYRNAFAKNVKLDDAELSLPIVGYSNLPSRGESLSQSMSDGIALFLKTNEESIALLHVATAMAHCRFTTNLNVSVIQHTEDNGLRHAAQKLELEAVYASNLGDDKSTTEALLASIGLVRHFSEEPLAIPRLVQQACFGLTKQGLEHALSSLQLDSNQLDSVSSALTATENSLSINNILAGELAWNDDIFSRIRQGKTLAAEFLMMDLKGDTSPPSWYWLPYCLAYQFGGSKRSIN